MKKHLMLSALLLLSNLKANTLTSLSEYTFIIKVALLPAYTLHHNINTNKTYQQDQTDAISAINDTQKN